MPPARNVQTSLTGTLEIARRDLLDLGLRNALLNYRPLRAKGVEVIAEKPVGVFRLLVREERSLTFRPAEEGALTTDGTVSDDDLAQPGDDLNGAARHKDLRLQTACASAQLQTRLLATFHAARTSMEEQGVNTLYLALGMLSWSEEDAGEKFCRAPLILIPVELARSDARDRFHLKYSGEELGDNVSLAEKLKQSFGIKSFPELPDPDDLDVDDYFNKVERAVRGRRGWTVDRRVSIHAPRAGRDRPLRVVWGKVNVSIHAPRAGRDLLLPETLRGIGVSIHAPRAGRDISKVKEPTSY